MKDFLLAMLIAVLGEGAPVPQVAIASFDERRLNGNTHCMIYTQSGPVCTVQIAKHRWRDHGRLPTVAQVRFNAGENTIVHELCHVKVYYDAVEQHADRDEHGHYHVSEQGGQLIGAYRSHGSAWARCMRTHRAWIDPMVAHR